MPASYKATCSFPSFTDLLWTFGQFTGLSNCFPLQDLSARVICHLTLETGSQEYGIAWPVRT